MTRFMAEMRLYRLASHRLHVAINLSPAPPEPLRVKMIFQSCAENVAPAGAASVWRAIFTEQLGVK